MERLAEVVRDASLGWAQKKTASLQAKQELLAVCADKALEFVKEAGAHGVGNSPSKRSRTQLSNTLAAIFEGQQQIFAQLLTVTTDSVSKED